MQLSKAWNSKWRFWHTLEVRPYLMSALLIICVLVTNSYWRFNCSSRFSLRSLLHSSSIVSFLCCLPFDSRLFAKFRLLHYFPLTSTFIYFFLDQPEIIFLFLNSTLSSYIFSSINVFKSKFYSLTDDGLGISLMLITIGFVFFFEFWKVDFFLIGTLCRPFCCAINFF